LPTKKPCPEEKPQSERFIETAREIGADETEEGFEKGFDLITRRNTRPEGEKPKS
jgi:hypothetical protein